MKKPIIKVVRIEHPKDRKGFWNTHNQELCDKHSKIKRIEKRHLNRDKFPNYNDDSELNLQIRYDEILKYKFAFKTLDQLREGFTNEEIKECIEELGFKVLLLSVNDYYESSYQVVFRKPIESEDISSLFI